MATDKSLQKAKELEQKVKGDVEENLFFIDLDCFQNCWDPIQGWLATNALIPTLMRHGIVNDDNDRHMLRKDLSPNERASNLLTLAGNAGRYGYHLLYMSIRDCTRQGHAEAVEMLVGYAKKKDIHPPWVSEDMADDGSGDNIGGCPNEGASVKKHSDSQNANGIALDPSPHKAPKENPLYTLESIKPKEPRFIRPADEKSFIADVKSFTKQVDLLLHTCNNHEYRAVMEQLEPPTAPHNGQQLAENPVSFSDKNGECTVGIFAGYKTAVIQTGQGNECRIPLEHAFIHFPELKVIIGVGIAYAKSEKLKFADVIVSKQIENASQVVMKDDGIENRGECREVEGYLQAIFCRATTSDWSVKDPPFYCTEEPQKRKPDIHSGLIVSTPWLLKDEKTKQNLLKYMPTALGGEMEGWVLLDLQTALRKKELSAKKEIGVIVIKGVVDYGNAQKADDWQPTAAKAAVEYVHFCLSKKSGSFASN